MPHQRYYLLLLMALLMRQLPRWGHPGRLGVGEGVRVRDEQREGARGGGLPPQPLLPQAPQLRMPKPPPVLRLPRQPGRQHALSHPGP